MTDTLEAEDSVAILDELLARGAIALRDDEVLRRTPPAAPRPIAFDRVEGMMLGLAIGDALGRPTEGRVPAKRRALHGEVRDYVIGRRAKRAIGMPSDDTQLAFWTLEQLIADRGYVPHNVAKRLCEGQVFGMGQTVSKFRRNFKKAKLPWWQAGPPSAGNGALMRIAPILIPHVHVHAPSSALWAEAALCAMTTHDDSASNAACVAMVAMLWDLLSMDAAPEPHWWLERYLEVASALETDAVYSPRGGKYVGYSGTLSRFVEQRVGKALKRGGSTVELCDSWHSGAYLLETMPCVILILARYGHDPEEALVRAVNDTKDNDTVGAIVGAAVGALHGKVGLPARWIEGLTGRTGDSDDGRVFELLDEARALWWPTARD